MSLALTVGLLVVVLTVQGANRREFTKLSDTFGGRGAITFRFKIGDIRVPEWTPDDLSKLADLPGVTSVEWSGGTLLAQGPASSHVVPLAAVSPGLISLLGHRVLAGRTFTTSDAEAATVVIGATVGEALFGSDDPNSFLGKTVFILDRNYSVIGVLDETTAAYRAVGVPAGPRAAGGYDVNTVYVLPGNDSDWGTLRNELADFLDQRADLSMLEPVRREQFLAGGVTLERVAFLREAGFLLQLLTWLVASFTAIISMVVAIVESHRSIERWAIKRALGASRLSLATNEVLGGSITAAIAVAVGAILGSVAAAGLLNSAPSPSAVVIAVLLGYGLYLLGSVPAAIRALSNQPGTALRSGSNFKSGSAVVIVAAMCISLAVAATITANGIFSTGRAALIREVNAVGATIVRLDPDISTLLPRGSLAPSDATRLREAFPQAKLTFIEQTPLPLSANGEQLQATVIRSDLDYPDVSGTKLAEGAWSDSGVVLGATLADALFPGRSALGQEVRVLGLSTSVGALPVVGVALEPTTEQLESLQLRPDAAWLPSNLVPDTRTARARIYLDAATLPDRNPSLVAATLSEFVPGYAPFVPQEVAGSNLNYLSSLANFERRFQLASVALLPLIASALVVIVVVGALSRRRLRTVERVVGAPWPDRVARELIASTTLILLTMIPALVISWTILHFWAAAGEHQLTISYAWLAIELMIVLVIGLALATVSALRALTLSPSQELAME